MLTRTKATKIKQDEQSFRTVKDTWEPILQWQPDLPNDWAHHREVLVGRSPRRLAPEGHVN